MLLTLCQNLWGKQPVKFFRHISHCSHWSQSSESSTVVVESVLILGRISTQMLLLSLALHSGCTDTSSSDLLFEADGFTKCENFPPSQLHSPHSHWITKQGAILDSRSICKILLITQFFHQWPQHFIFCSLNLTAIETNTQCFWNADPANSTLCCMVSSPYHGALVLMPCVCIYILVIYCSPWLNLMQYRQIRTIEWPLFPPCKIPGKQALIITM